MTGTAPWTLRCIDCAREHAGLDRRTRCACGGTLEVARPLTGAAVDSGAFDARRASRRPIDRSGVWRYRELVLPLADDALVTRPEGNTNLYESPRVAAWCGLDRLQLKHEGENPTGSFKDRGMCVAVTVARLLGCDRVACASTGNTAASMAAYAAQTGMRAYVFLPQGHVARAKLAQSIAYGATLVPIAGDFDQAMALVEATCRDARVYLVNSINPFRIEGQKAIAFELLHDRAWRAPDWIVLPGGNLGNSSAIYKAVAELHALRIIDRLPRIAVIQAEGANPLARAFRSGGPVEALERAETIASAIRIGAPVSWKKSLRGVHATGGVVEDVTDAEILAAKRIVDQAGIGAEPASCAAVAGIRKLVRSGVVRGDADVCGILTGHVLKDPDAVIGSGDLLPAPLPPDPAALRELLLRA